MMSFKEKLKRKLSLYFRRALRALFKFDRWHLSCLHQRQYAIDIIKYLNDVKNIKSPKILELGCGLGDIISNINGHERLGLDIDKNVINAATFKSKIFRHKNIKFQCRDLFASELMGQYHSIIMVNWIHNIKPNTLKLKIQSIFKNNLNKKGMLILDTVSSVDYKYNHSVEELLESIECSIFVLGNYERGRKIFVISKL